MSGLVEPIRDKKDIDKIIIALEKLNHQSRIIFEIGLYSGLRISDILDLKVCDVKGKNFIEKKEIKTGKFKKFPIRENLKKFFIELMEEKEDEEFLFIGKHYEKLHRSVFYRHLVFVCKRLGINCNIGTHSMRKTFGYHHYKQFKDVALLQKIFNHSSPVITLRYIGIEQEEINKNYNDFSYQYEETKSNENSQYKRQKANFSIIQNQLQSINLTLEIIKEKIKKIENKSQLKYEKYLKNYINNGGIKHRDFALEVLNCAGE